MQISWRQYLEMKLAKRTAIFALGISLGKDTNHVVGLVKCGAEVTWAYAAEFPAANFKKEFSTWVTANNLAGTPTYISFSEKLYQLLQVDRPDVEDSALHEALRWPLKELVTTDKEIAYDYFDIPVQTGSGNKVNAVAIEYDKVAGICQLAFDLKLPVKKIIVEELAIAELVKTQTDAVMTLTQEAGGELCLNIFKEGHLYLTRRLRGFDNLGEFNETELRMGVLESLCIQIQRSLDFFTNQLRQASVRHIFLNIPIDLDELVMQDIQSIIDIPVTRLTPPIENTVEIDVQRFSLNAIGAAMIALNMQHHASNKDAA